MVDGNSVSLLEKIRRLPAEKVVEVEDFVDFLQQRAAEGELRTAVTRVSESSFARVWENPDDAEYDKL